MFKLQASTWWGGIVLLLLSSLLLSFYPASADGGGPLPGSFIFNFACTVIYFFVLIINRKTLPAVSKLYHWLLLFSLLLISAWALNKDMNVFELAVNWFAIAQVLVCVSFIALAFYRFFPAVVNHLFVFILGAGLLLFGYMSLYLFPLYIFGVLGAVGLGISLHCFAPLLIFIGIVYLLLKMVRHNKNYRWSFLAGTAAALVFAMAFCVVWVSQVREVNKLYRRAVINENPDLPAWMQFSQRLPASFFTEKILKSDLVYAVPDGSWDIFKFNARMRNFDEQAKHDPLIMLASLFAKPSIGNDDKIKILRASADNRHYTEERLWSGNHLVTQSVLTTVKIWPQWQLAYTEKTITVKNQNKENGWPREEEAIYTFYLPEGSVVSSLSLWINGIEEKGVLTTKEKAATAYQTIVGRERRDPSVVHWQEGNMVTVRVFPVMAGNNRVFKIGITSPLVKNNSRITYQNAWFRGPDHSPAQEDIHIDIDKAPASLDVPVFLKDEQNGKYFYDGAYKNYWELNFDATPAVSPEPFVFNNKSYSLQRYRKQFTAHAFRKFYLDLHAQWTREELENVLQLLKGREVYVQENGFVRLEEGSQQLLLNKLLQLRFTLFPIYDIPDPANALLVTKGDNQTPLLDDMEATPYSKKLDSFLHSNQQLAVVDLGQETSGYIKTLREYRAIQYERMDMDGLEKTIRENSFPADVEDKDHLVLKDAELIITRSDSSVEGRAPDHLLRLFAYNTIMKQTGDQRNQKPEENSVIVQEAELAHIVSPVSSLIVLETQADYDRFDIHDKGGLANASHKKSGAVPEPHEWVLIILGILFLLYTRYQTFLKRLVWRRS